MHAPTKPLGYQKLWHLPLTQKILDRFNTHFPEGFDREGLFEILFNYRHEGSVRKLPTIHEARKPLGKVLKIMDQRRNWDAFIEVLHGGNDCSLISWLQAEEKFCALFQELRTIYRSLPPPPRRGRGKPPKTGAEFRVFVEQLMIFWEQQTHKKFTQDWITENGRRKPITEGTRFVYDVVDLHENRALDSLPSVTRQVVAQRR
jgi:hypothetical protein